jgi:hypothetical protein
MPNSTTNYAFNLPLVNDPIDSDLWGGQLNANWSSLDTLLNAVGVKTGGGLESSDSLFRVVDNADATKKLAFEVSGIGTGTTRTIAVTDTSLAIPANATAPSSLVLAEDTDNGSNTATIIAPAALGGNRVLTLPDATGELISSARVASDTVAGIVELATTAETQTGTDTTRAVTPAGLLGALGFSRTFESAEQTVQAALIYSAPHGLGAIPKIIQVLLRCKTAEQGYAVGDEALVAYVGTAGSNTIHAWASATSIGLITGTNALPSFALNNRSTAAAFLPTPANWRFVVRAWA